MMQGVQKLGTYVHIPILSHRTLQAHVCPSIGALYSP